MPKVKWQGDLSTDDIDSAENRGGEEYIGPIPPSGIYQFKLRFAKKAQAQSGKPKLQILWLLDSTWKPSEHKKYDGCPLWDNMPVQKSTAWRIKAFCDALNITSAEFMNKMLVDDDGFVQKIGSLKIADTDLQVRIKVKFQDEDAEYPKSIRLNGGGYLPFKEDEDEDPEPETDADDEDSKSNPEDDPF